MSRSGRVEDSSVDAMQIEMSEAPKAPPSAFHKGSLAALLEAQHLGTEHIHPQMKVALQTFRGAPSSVRPMLQTVRYQLRPFLHELGLAVLLPVGEVVEEHEAGLVPPLVLGQETELQPFPPHPTQTIPSSPMRTSRSLYSAPSAFLKAFLLMPNSA